MTQENKDLLLRDLSARLPYGVEVKYDNSICEVLAIDTYNEEVTIWKSSGNSPKVKLEKVKPFLLPLSSMTEEEKEELKQEHIKDQKLYVECLTRAAKGDSSIRGKVIIHYAMDWCNANHFDYRGLIEKGLAIDATGLNIY